MANTKPQVSIVDSLYEESKIDQPKSIIIKTNSWFVYYQLKTNLIET